MRAFVKKDPEGGGAGKGGAGGGGWKHCSDDDCISKYIAAVHHLRNLKLDKSSFRGRRNLVGVDRRTSKGKFETENCKKKKKKKKKERKEKAPFSEVGLFKRSRLPCRELTKCFRFRNI
jgi:hypothetical protein